VGERKYGAPLAVAQAVSKPTADCSMCSRSFQLRCLHSKAPCLVPGSIVPIPLTQYELQLLSCPAHRASGHLSDTQPGPHICGIYSVALQALRTCPGVVPAVRGLQYPLSKSRSRGYRNDEKLPTTRRRPYKWEA